MRSENALDVLAVQHLASDRVRLTRSRLKHMTVRLVRDDYLTMWSSLRLLKMLKEFHSCFHND
jgi:hypothetical protein